MKTSSATITVLSILFLSLSLPATSNANTIAIQTIIGEASQEPLPGQIAVAEVIRLRASIGGWWGSSFKYVCLNPFQFSFWNDKSRSQKRISNMSGTEWQRAGRAWAESEFTNYSNGATHYENIKAFGDPKWKRDMKEVARIGKHVFYREKWRK